MSPPEARILLVITASGIGGTEKVVSWLARSLSGGRYEPLVCTLRPPGEMAREAAEGGVEVFSLGFEGRGALGLPGALALGGRLAREARARRVDLIHSFLFLANMAGRLAARRLGLPHISSVRVEEREKGYHHLAERLTSRLVGAYLAPSRRVARYAAARSGVSHDRFTVIPNPVEEPKPGAPRLRPLLGLPPGAPLAGFVGRLHRQKGVDVLLRAWALLAPEARPRLAVVGDGPERGALEALARELGLGNSVSFTGWLPGAAALLPELDLLVLPSRWEGLPNVVLEAMAAGVPVAATSAGGVPELIEDGRTGFLAPVGDARALASIVEGWRAGRLDAGGAAARAREAVLERHRPAAVLAAYEALYAKMLGGGTRP